MTFELRLCLRIVQNMLGGYTKIFPKVLPESEFFRRLCHLDFEQVRFSNVKGVVPICAKPFA